MFVPGMGTASWQVFGLAGYLLAPASRSMAEPVLISKRLFLLTAAGQFRILTGFPFQPDLSIEHREVKPLYQGFMVWSSPTSWDACAFPTSSSKSLCI